MALCHAKYKSMSLPICVLMPDNEAMTNTNQAHGRPTQANIATLREAMGPGYQVALRNESILREGSPTLTPHGRRDLQDVLVAVVAMAAAATGLVRQLSGGRRSKPVEAPLVVAACSSC